VSIIARCCQRYGSERGPHLISHPKEKKKGKYLPAKARIGKYALRARQLALQRSVKA